MGECRKPLGTKAYGSIPHLPGSRRGPADQGISEGQARIALEQVRDKHDKVWVQEKLDGSCVAAALINGEVVPLTRAGYHARSSPHVQHHYWADWVAENEDRFRKVLREGTRLVGEWLAQAHGTRYRLGPNEEPFIAFDLMGGTERLPLADFYESIDSHFQVPALLSGEPTSVETAMRLVDLWSKIAADDPIEGAVWRVERKGEVDFLCKFVRHDKVDGKYLPEISGGEPVWNWKPKEAR